MDIIDARELYFIAGPTASGKSATAIKLAEAKDGEIINADAMQVYADLSVLTACPTPEEQEIVPHHLYGVLDGAEKCSAGRWARLAHGVIQDVLARGKTPIVVGGTGLYFKSLDEGLSPIPDVPEEVRAEGQQLYDEIGGERFRELVLAFDPEMSWLPPSDRQRLIRAFEVHKATGKPLSHFQNLPRVPLVKGNISRAVIAPERDVLYANCERRFDLMLEAGALEEVQQLLARKLGPMLPVMKSLGVPELSAHLSGEISLEQASELAKRNTRRFAKRQMTWFRGQAGEWPRYEPDENFWE